MGGVQLPFTIIFDFLLRSSRYEKYFLQVLSKLSQASMVRFFFYFSDELKVVSVAPQGGCTHPHKSRGVFFQTYWPRQVG